MACNNVSDDEFNLDLCELDNDLEFGEVFKCIQKLKNDKACGQDLILNEFLKHSSSKLLYPITLLFNVVLKSGKVPEAWSKGVICPIYKGKGSQKDADNYRGIIVLSVLIDYIVFTTFWLKYKQYAIFEGIFLFAVQKATWV